MSARLEPYPQVLQPPILQSPTKNPTWEEVVDKNHGNLCGDLLTPTITPTGWTTDPTSLTLIYDGDRTTVTGEALDTAMPTVETNADSEIKVDLGALYHVESVYVKYESRSLGAGGNVSTRVRGGDLGDLTDEDLGSDGGIGTVGTILHSRTNYPNFTPSTAESFLRYVTLRQWQPGGPGAGGGLKVYEVIIVGERRAT